MRQVKQMSKRQYSGRFIVNLTDNDINIIQMSESKKNEPETHVLCDHLDSLPLTTCIKYFNFWSQKTAFHGSDAVASNTYIVILFVYYYVNLIGCLLNREMFSNSNFNDISWVQLGWLPC